MITEASPRHSIKARRKQKEETGRDTPTVEAPSITTNNDDSVDASNNVDLHIDSNNNNINNDSDAWRRKYEDVVRRRRSPVAATIANFNNNMINNNNNNTLGNNNVWGNSTVGRMKDLSPLSIKSSAVNSVTSMSQADMEFILATSMDTNDQLASVNSDLNSIEPMIADECNSRKSNYSADSIIRRVEAEIAAARKSAAQVKHNQYRNNNNVNSLQNEEDDDDMAQILDTTNTFSDHNPTMNDSISPSTVSSADSSKYRAMNLIRDEFRETSEDPTITEMDNGDLPIEKEDASSPKRSSHDTDPSTNQESSLFPFEEKKEDGNENGLTTIPFSDMNEKDNSSVAPSTVTNATDSGTPTRRNYHRGTKDLDPVSSATIDQSRNTRESKGIVDPDGDYRSNATTPPRPSPSHFSSVTKTSQFPPLSPTSALQQHQRRITPMDKNRELLDSLKEQRHSLPKSSSSSPKTAATQTQQQQPDITSASPRTAQKNQLTQSEANNTVITGSRTTGSAVLMALPPPSPSSASVRNINDATTYQQNRNQIFPDEVYALAKESSVHNESINGGTDQSRRIRFRNPFPIIHPPRERRSLEEKMNEYALDIPDAPVRWIKPKQELKQLIVAAMGTSLPRRSNACGALKVLTRQEKNQLSLVRTDGFLQAITYAASQSVLDVDTDLAIDARTRAVTCFKNVCHPKDNRVLILNHPGVIECLLKVVQQDDGAGRATAAAAIALLAKTPNCREYLARIDGLIDTMAKVMRSAATMISEEAMIVRKKSFSPRGGNGNNNYGNLSPVDENDVPVDRPMGQESNRKSEHPALEEAASTITESSSLSSTDGTNPQSKNVGEVSISMIGSKLLDVRSVDSIRNQNEERYDEFVNQARCNACAALLHISKQCATSHDLATNDTFISCVAAVAREVDHPIHTKCLEILCNISRLPENNSILTRFDGVIDTLIMSSNSSNGSNRVAALRTLQNMSADPGSKALLATSPVLNLLTSCAMRKDTEEKDIAVATLYNITTEPGAVTAITNTKNVVATLVHLAHSPDSSSDVRLLACEALATISLWLQTLAGTGKVPDGIANVPLPSQRTTGWERWD